MKKLLAVAAFAAIAASASAFDVTDYTVENLVTLSELEAVTAAGVRCRGVTFDAANPGVALLFASQGADIWFLTYDLDTETLTVIGNDTVNNLKGSGTSVVRGAFAAANGVIAYHDGGDFGTIAGVEVNTGNFIPSIVTDGAIGALASLSHLDGDLWIGGASLDDTNGADMDLFLIDSNAGTATVIDTIKSMQDVAAISATSALVADGWNRLLYLAEDVTTTYSKTNITPTGWGFPAPKTIKGMDALSDDFYVIHDTSPSGFDDDIIAVWDGTSITELVLSDIAPAGELYPNFHTGMALLQPDSNTIHLYIANFNNFANEPALVRIVWTQQASVSDWLIH